MRHAWLDLQYEAAFSPPFYDGTHWALPVAEELAKEARQLAQALESGGIDPNVIDRQQRLFRRMLDAGRTLERDEREDNGKREAKAATGAELFLPPNAAANGKAASRFAPPNWNDLRGLTPEERRLVLDYFKRINAEKP